MPEVASTTGKASECMQPAPQTNMTPYLESLSRLAARSFGSTAEVLEVVLETIVEQVGMRTALLTRIARAEGRNTVLAACNRPGGCNIAIGAELPLEDTF